MTTEVTIVVPTLGRPSLTALLDSLAGAPFDVIVVDDRPAPAADLTIPVGVIVKIVPGPARGPAAARNVGWRTARTEWIAFLDDDVLPGPDWVTCLADDLLRVADDVGGSQGRLHVPLPDGRRPTDRERMTAGLARGAWITADMAYRRRALQRTGGFDERFPRAFREDAELAYRVRRAGWTLTRGRRKTTHPVRPENRWVSVRTQRGNADDALLRRMYGPGWRSLLGIPAGRRARHVVVAAAALAVLVPNRSIRTAAAIVWAAGTAEFAAARIAPGPGTPAVVTTMLATSAVIPPLAVAHWLRGYVTARGAKPLVARQ